MQLSMLGSSLARRSKIVFFSSPDSLCFMLKRSRPRGPCRSLKLTELVRAEKFDQVLPLCNFLTLYDV